MGVQRIQDFHNMKRHLSKAGAVWIIITFVTISFSFTALAAMKKKFSMSIKMENLSLKITLWLLEILIMQLNKE